ncbi:CoA transferase [Hamadaea tsunoensis]|uniref:CoA transferase n=1 Tax=Hamadaea tsunoensis TaxID=53368 RepID=UPI0003F69CB1|nr:CoA transferase [Hamadaea tsunoensis]
MRTAFEQAWAALGGGQRPEVEVVDAPVLPGALPTADLALATVAACACAAAELAVARGGPPVPVVRVDAARVATAFTSERHLRRGTEAFTGFAPESAFFAASDGWVRTHANYPHHRDRLTSVVGADVAAGIARRTAIEVEEDVLAAGGLAFAVRPAGQWPAGDVPLIARRPVPGPHQPLPTPHDGRPSDGVRVLDLTRVIAGPVATRALALLGADVLRVDSPRLPEIEGQHLDTGLGKRTTLLDLDRAADRATFEELLSGADVVITGYRPGALDRFGLTPDALLERRPGLIVGRLAAWTGGWSGRRGFDSLVQAATGIALREGHDDRPGALPAQALDHGSGYLLAAAVLRALARRHTDGHGAVLELALARTAEWLLALPAREHVAGRAPEPTTVELGGLTVARPAFGDLEWPAPPRPWGRDAAAW